MTFAANAKWPIASAHTNEERRGVLAVLEGFGFQVQRDCVPVLEILNDPTPPWVQV